MKKFNINEYMYIQINECGWHHLLNTVGKDYIKYCIESHRIEIENEIWYKLQCHEVFNLFPMNFGSKPFFNTNIMFEDKDLTD